MTSLIIPKGYHEPLSIRETEKAIKLIKDSFEVELSKALNLTRVSAPLFVKPETGLNDNLNGTERPVAFDILEQDGAIVEIVHSLAKWKRYALKRYEFNVGEGLYTDMNAIRRDETTDNLHSLYVDQWDWEKIINKSDRNVETLKQTVKSIYNVLKRTEELVCSKYSHIQPILPDEITFVTTQELEDLFPGFTAKQREDEIARRYKAVFLMQIGGKLKSGEIHDGRAPDYDDWSLNGDIILYYPLFDKAFEVSSMGIRVDEETLIKQLEERGCTERKEMDFQKALLNGELPYTIGGGIGQSRVCMFMLRKAHIGQVQSSSWPEETEKLCANAGIELL